MMYGRLDAAAAISEGSLKVEGDGDLAALFGQWFKGFRQQYFQFRERPDGRRRIA